MAPLPTITDLVTHALDTIEHAVLPTNPNGAPGREAKHQQELIVESSVRQVEIHAFRVSSGNWHEPTSTIDSLLRTAQTHLAVYVNSNLAQKAGYVGRLIASLNLIHSSLIPPYAVRHRPNVLHIEPDVVVCNAPVPACVRECITEPSSRPVHVVRPVAPHRPSSPTPTPVYRPSRASKSGSNPTSMWLEGMNLWREENKPSVSTMPSAKPPKPSPNPYAQQWATMKK